MPHQTPASRRRAATLGSTRTRPPERRTLGTSARAPATGWLAARANRLRRKAEPILQRVCNPPYSPPCAPREAFVKLFDLGPRCAHLRPHGRRAGAEQARDFVGRQPFEVAKHQRLALFLRQRVQGL